MRLGARPRPSVAGRGMCSLRVAAHVPVAEGPTVQAGLGTRRRVLAQDLEPDSTSGPRRSTSPRPPQVSIGEATSVASTR